MKQFLLIIVLLMGLSALAQAQVSIGGSCESHSGTTGSTSEANFEIPDGSTCNAGASLQGGFVCVAGSLTSARTDTGVTWGGQAMTFIDEAISATAEPMHMSLYFLSSPPSGAQTIQVTRTNDATRLYAIATGVDASTTNTEVTGLVKQQGVTAAAEQNVDDGSPGTDSLRFACGAFAVNAIPTGGANSTLSLGIDFGTETVSGQFENTAGQGSRAVGPATQASDDVAAVYFAIREILTTAVQPGTLLGVGR